MYIIIENQGVAEQLGMRLMGGSSKTEEQIGRFGTGWKYGMAGVVRLCGLFNITVGPETLIVASTPVVLRGTEHNEVTINGQPIGITDQLGKDWEPWMILREFISNAVDEGAASVTYGEEVTPEEGKTKVYVPIAPFQEVLDSLNDYFCLAPVPGEFVTPYGRAIPKRDRNLVNIFKKGVRVKTEASHSAFDYELNDVNIGEDRIAGDIRKTLWTFLDNAPLAVKKQVVTHYFEADSYQYTTPSPQWKEVFGDKLIVSTKSGHENELIVPYQLVEIANRVGARTLKSDFAARSATRETMPASFTAKEACKKLSKIGLPINPKLVLMAKLDHGDVLTEEGLTYLSKDLNEESIYESLIISATTTWSHAEQLKLLAKLVRSLMK